jgi:hypothetical protein
MKYGAFIWTDGLPVPEALAVMQQELAPWVEEMDRRGARLAGRELDLPETAITVRVRDGEVLLSDGPFAETKEFIAGLDLLECADLDEAIEVMAKSPVARFHPIEIRPFRPGVELGELFSAFAREQDGATRPYLLSTWIDEAQPLAGELEAWRQDLGKRGLHILGGDLEDTTTATTVRVRDGETVLSDGPPAGESVAGVEVVSCADRQQATELAAAHPLARYGAIEVRPFYSE